jgi:hypothetical protein
MEIESAWPSPSKRDRTELVTTQVHASRRKFACKPVATVCRKRISLASVRAAEKLLLEHSGRNAHDDAGGRAWRTTVNRVLAQGFVR